MKFKVDEKLFQKFPTLTIGLVIAKGINNKGEIQKIQQILRKEEGEIRGKYNLKTIMENPKIIVWQKAYISFGAKPKKHKSSVENATGELKTLIAKYCGGEVTSVMVDNSNCEIVIS